jgi:hypothetical protein
MPRQLAASFNCHFAGFPWRRRFSFAAAWFAPREEANQFRKDGSSLYADNSWSPPPAVEVTTTSEALALVE